MLCVLAAVTSSMTKLDPVLAAYRGFQLLKCPTLSGPRINMCIFSGVRLVCLNVGNVWVELCVYRVDYVVFSRWGDVLCTGAGWRDILDNSHHTETHTLTFTHTRSLTARITETTQSLWPFLKPNHDLDQTIPMT